jgi:hypothetical protein
MSRSTSERASSSRLCADTKDQHSKLTRAEKERIYSRDRYRSDPSRAKGYTANYARNNRRARYCNLLVHLALKSGKLIRQPCEVCGAVKTDAHHDDYSQPLAVRWLCRSHHKKHHAKRKAA